MKRLFNLFIALVSLFISYFSIVTLANLTTFQKSVSDLNQNSSESSFHQLTKYALNYKPIMGLETWDADVNYILATANINQAHQTQNIGVQQNLFSQAQDHYHKGLSLRPRDVNILTAQLTLLIDQGVPLTYALNKLDQIISLVPKDQDLKAELSVICFKLLSQNPDENSELLVSDRLSQLFRLSMDYRGITLVKRYAKFYGQQETLTKVLARHQ